MIAVSDTRLAEYRGLNLNYDEHTSVSDLVSELKRFLKERDWEKHHNPKDLAESVCIEAAANALKIDLSKAVLEKLQSNRKKYPADLYFGKAHL